MMSPFDWFTLKWLPLVTLSTVKISLGYAAAILFFSGSWYRLNGK
jgi:hypothetical protein